MDNSDKKEELASLGGERRAASSKESGGGLGTGGIKMPECMQGRLQFFCETGVKVGGSRTERRWA